MRSEPFANQSLSRYGPFVASMAHEPPLRAWLRSFYALGRFFKTTIKGFLVFFSILPFVITAAAVIGCLTLSNGDVAYLLDPQKLFDFVFNVRAGLKVNIMFVTFLLFFLCVNNGVLSRSWLRRSAPSAFHI